MRRLTASILMVACTALTAAAQGAATPPPASVPSPSVDPDRLALARKILDETHAQDTMQTFLDTFIPSMMANIKRNAPNLPDDTFKLISQMFADEMRNQLPNFVSLDAQVYASHFTLDELKALDTFYQSPAGQKVIAETPKILKETAPVGQLWGRQAAQAAMEKVIAALRAKGVKI